MHTTADIYLNPHARHAELQRPSQEILEFHRSLPGYTPTPLTELPEVAAALGVDRVFIKDESARMGLPAFKVLGASYAVARALAAHWGSPADASIDQLRATARSQPCVTLLCATDGNHGRAVARMAANIGVASRVFIPASLTAAAKQAILSEGADVREITAPYDEVVTTMRVHADELGDSALVIQDTSWNGYEEVPGWIVDGYSTMLAELDLQLRATGDARVDLVVAPAGVGSLAQAIVTHFRSTATPPVVGVVEPIAAPAVLHALSTGTPEPVPTTHTVMLGLNCGTVSALAWPVLHAGVDAAVLVTDDEAIAAVHTLQAAGVDAGPCGAAGLAGATRLLRDAREPLALTEHSTIVLFNTESLTANPV